MNNRHSLSERVAEMQSYVRLNQKDNKYQVFLDLVRVGRDGAFYVEGFPTDLSVYENHLKQVVKRIRNGIYQSGSHFGLTPYKHASKPQVD